MAITNHERIGKALDLRKDGLRLFVEWELMNVHKKERLRSDQSYRRRPVGLVRNSSLKVLSSHP